MAISAEALDKINGDGSAEALAAVRARNAQVDAYEAGRCRAMLAEAGGERRVVSSDTARQIGVTAHTGE